MNRSIYVAVDGFEASASDRVGVGRLEVELFKSIERYDTYNKYQIFTPYEPRQDLPKIRNGWNYTIPVIKRLWSQLALPLYLYSHPKPDVFFAPIHYAPRFCPCPIVLGIMDVSYLLYPDLFRSRDLYKLQNWTSYSIKKAQQIITISQSTKNDILKQYNVPNEIVHVIYPGLTKKMNQSSDSKSNSTNITFQSLKEHYHIRGDYILYVGTLQPRKNIIRLIEAFRSIKLNNNNAMWNNLQLIIVGKKGWMYDEIFEHVKKKSLENDVLFTGFIDDYKLSLFYQHARCFCLVSLYEGFGFPVLEAMYKGVPVVASNVSSLPELVNGYGELVDPMSIDNIAIGIMSVLNMGDTERKDRIKKAKQYALTFTWERSAKQTIEILEKVGNKR